MKTLTILTGTPEWHAHRDNPAVLNASEASAMMGANGRRGKLVRQMATGIREEISPQLQKIFDEGHRVEALARPIAEEFIGEDLSPVTGVQEVDGLTLSASFDGIDFDHKTTWECKQWNADKAEYMRANYQVPPEDYWQVVQQLVVSGAKRTIYTLSDGTPERTIHVTMSLKDADRERLIAGWKQLLDDVANYQHIESKPEAVAEHIEALPALLVQVEGRVLATNLDKFKEAATTFIAKINTNLQTDNDFATADKMVKFLADGEKQLAQVKQHAQAQASDIDAVFRAIDDISAQMREKRLALDKLVKAEKENRKGEIVSEAQNALMEHRAALVKRIGGNWLPPMNASVFADAIKGLKTLDSMRDKLSTALANAKIEANEVADRIELNARAAKDHMHLLPDFAGVCTKATDDFAALLALRIQQDEQRKEAEREKIRLEEADLQAKVQAATNQRVAENAQLVTPSMTAQPHAPATSTPPNHIADAGKMITDQKAQIEAFLEKYVQPARRNNIRSVLMAWEQFKREEPMEDAA